MKRKLLFVLAVVTAFIQCVIVSQASTEVTIEGKRIESDVSAEIRNGRTLLPMRTIFEALGAEVKWNEAERKAVASKGGNTITVSVDSDILLKNGEPIQLDVPAVIEHDKILVPVRAVAEALECGVIWNELSHTVYIDVLDESAHDESLKKYLDKSMYRICEAIKTDYGTVIYYMIISPHGGAPAMVLIDNDGEIYSLYSDAVPAVSPFKYARCSSITLGSDGKTLRYTTALPEPYVFDGQTVSEAGIYEFEADLESKKAIMTKFTPIG